MSLAALALQLHDERTKVSRMSEIGSGIYFFGRL